MKVVLVNGSRNEFGCIHQALSIIAEELKANGIDSQIIYVGSRACNGKINEAVDELGQAMQKADGLIVGSPVYYASPSGEVIAVLDRLFGKYGADMRFKPASAVASARRAGTTASLDVINKYFSFNNMPIVSASYWNNVHGSQASDVLLDLEGVQNLKVLARNMAWLLKCIEAGKEKDIKAPELEEKIKFNYVR